MSAGSFPMMLFETVPDAVALDADLAEPLSRDLGVFHVSSCSPMSSCGKWTTVQWPALAKLDGGPFYYLRYVAGKVMDERGDSYVKDILRVS